MIFIDFCDIYIYIYIVLENIYCNMDSMANIDMSCSPELI